MNKWINIHGVKRLGENRYACINCKNTEPLMYVYGVRVARNVVRYTCRCRNCRRMITVDVEDWAIED